MKKVKKILNEDEKIIKEAEKLYNKGEWLKAIEMINTLTIHNEQENRMKAWNYYYLAIKGDESYKMENLEKAEEYFELSLAGAKEDKTKVSVLSGLPLALWILGKEQEAWEISDKAIDKFPEESPIWNTRSILCRWAQDFEKAVEVCEKVYKTAIEIGDWKMAGHGKHNQGDALLKLGKEKEALESYREAEKMYTKDGKSDFHLKAVIKKIQKVKSN